MVSVSQRTEFAQTTLISIRCKSVAQRAFRQNVKRKSLSCHTAYWAALISVFVALSKPFSRRR